MAVTRTRRKEPLSAAFTVYVFEVAPVIAVHAAGIPRGFFTPAFVQLYHWYAYVTGPLVHWPRFAARVEPTFTNPFMTRGGFAFTLAGFAPTLALVAETILVAPPEPVART